MTLLVIGTGAGESHDASEESLHIQYVPLECEVSHFFLFRIINNFAMVREETETNLAM
jgi:hypothetical protein